jgi:hypothetical protein
MQPTPFFFQPSSLTLPYMLLMKRQLDLDTNLKAVLVYWRVVHTNFSL